MSHKQNTETYKETQIPIRTSKTYEQNTDLYIYIYKAHIPRPKCGSCHRATMVIAVRAHCNPLDIYIYISKTLKHISKTLKHISKTLKHISKTLKLILVQYPKTYKQKVSKTVRYKQNIETYEQNTETYKQNTEIYKQNTETYKQNTEMYKQKHIMY